MKIEERVRPEEGKHARELTAAPSQDNRCHIVYMLWARPQPFIWLRRLRKMSMNLPENQSDIPQSQTTERNTDFPKHNHDGRLNNVRRGPSITFIFPVKLYNILSRSDLSHIITWMPHGHSWIVLDKQAFVEQVMPEYFSQSQYASFIRQVNGWGFRRMKKGKNKGSYYNKLFLRGEQALARTMKREAVSKRSSAESEPNFSSYPPLPSGEESKDVQNNGFGSSPVCHSHSISVTAESFDLSPSMSDQKYSYSADSNMYNGQMTQHYCSHPMREGYSTGSYPEYPVCTHRQASFVGHNSLHATATFAYPRYPPQVPSSDWAHPPPNSSPYPDFLGPSSRSYIPYCAKGAGEGGTESPINRDHAVESYEEYQPEDWELLRDSLYSLE